MTAKMLAAIASIGEKAGFAQVLSHELEDRIVHLVHGKDDKLQKLLHDDPDEVGDDHPCGQLEGIVYDSIDGMAQKHDAKPREKQEVAAREDTEQTIAHRVSNN